MKLLTVACATLMALSATQAGAAYVVNTGEGSALPNSAPIGFQTGTAVQFTLTRETEITGIEIFGTVATGGRISFNLSISDNNTAPNPINVIYYREGNIAATGTQPGWVGLTNLSGITLGPGTYWTQSGSDGILTAVQYGSAPNPLGNEARFLPTGGYQEADALNLSWRISGIVAADPAPAVPEPATWAMMIGGFAVTGWALRRRRVSVAFA